LQAVREDYPVTLHGVGMSLGSTDPLDRGYLEKVRSLARRIEPAWISDHLCWTGVGGRYAHELLPLPHTEEAVTHAVGRIQQVQELLGQSILIENVASYLTFADGELSEWEFLTAVAERADCLILLDINNVYVNARNHGFNPPDYLDGVPPERVWQFHLAGYEDRGTHLLDTHGAPVHPPVWELYRAAIARFGPIPTLIEWDKDVPPFSVLEREMVRAATILEERSPHAVG
jgi:uncharacterized protein (UPF0276 family)